MAEKSNVFTCRVCGHHEFEEERSCSGVIGSPDPGRLLYHYCNKCTSIFLNPERFSSTPYKKPKKKHRLGGPSDLSPLSGPCSQF